MKFWTGKPQSQVGHITQRGKRCSCFLSTLKSLGCGGAGERGVNQKEGIKSPVNPSGPRKSWLAVLITQDSGLVPLALKSNTWPWTRVNCGVILNLHKFVIRGIMKLLALGLLISNDHEWILVVKRFGISQEMLLSNGYLLKATSKHPQIPEVQQCKCECE